jgi:hypothetical protein
MVVTLQKEKVGHKEISIRTSTLLQSLATGIKEQFYVLPARGKY